MAFLQPREFAEGYEGISCFIVRRGSGDTEIDRGVIDSIECQFKFHHAGLLDADVFPNLVKVVRFRDQILYIVK